MGDADDYLRLSSRGERVLRCGALMCHVCDRAAFTLRRAGLLFLAGLLAAGVALGILILAVAF
jgi:hypothetical protein